MPHDVLGLGVAGRLLVQIFHSGHAFAFLRCLGPVGQADQARADLKWAKQHQAQAHPAGGQDTEVQGLAVKEMKKSVVGITAQVKNPHKAGDPGVVRAGTQTHQDKSHSHKGQ